MKNIDQYKVFAHDSIRDAVKKIDEGGLGFCVCVDEGDCVIGVVTDGDFRRAVHQGIELDENILEIANRNFLSVQKNYDKQEVEKIFKNSIIQQVPVLEEGKLIGIITVEEFYGVDKGKKRRILNSPVVIMAGGKGTRLDPFTRILPKPLIPLGNDPIIKVIMDEFHKFGMNHFIISLNDKERMVKAYFHDHQLSYQISYVQEETPLGTAGALKYLEGRVKEAFFVSNCDIIIRTDYGSFYDFHKDGGYALTMVGSMRQYTIPYGVCDVDNAGMLKAMREKPQYDFLVSTGMYLLEPSVLKFIPEGEHFNMTDLIRKVQQSGLKVGIFPVSERSWIDIGQLSEYKEIINKMNLHL